MVGDRGHGRECMSNLKEEVEEEGPQRAKQEKALLPINKVTQL